MPGANLNLARQHCAAITEFLPEAKKTLPIGIVGKTLKVARGASVTQFWIQFFNRGSTSSSINLSFLCGECFGAIASPLVFAVHVFGSARSSHLVTGWAGAHRQLCTIIPPRQQWLSRSFCMHRDGYLLRKQPNVSPFRPKHVFSRGTRIDNTSRNAF